MFFCPGNQGNCVCGLGAGSSSQVTPLGGYGVRQAWAYTPNRSEAPWLPTQWGVDEHGDQVFHYFSSVFFKGEECSPPMCRNANVVRNPLDKPDLVTEVVLLSRMNCTISIIGLDAISKMTEGIPHW